MKRVLTERADAVSALAEVFREHGFEGASLSLLSKATGLGKGSLYNFFPGGKEEMMEAVLATSTHGLRRRSSRRWSRHMIRRRRSRP